MLLLTAVCPSVRPTPEHAATGARQLGWSDVHSGANNFRPLFDFLAGEVVYSPDPERIRLLPAATWAGLQSVVASFLPLYLPPEASCPWSWSCRCCQVHDRHP